MMRYGHPSNPKQISGVKTNPQQACLSHPDPPLPSCYSYSPGVRISPKPACEIKVRNEGVLLGFGDVGVDNGLFKRSQ